jgi:exopolysaccharide biosynthesis polyprenyl glycosylphosphotransferase
MLAISILVKLTSRGPLLFKQERVSFDGTPFRIIKFRTMYIDAEVAGPGWTKPGDERITPLGRLLRSTSLDELPQLFNVLRGDMSIVGPRPERPVYIREFRRHIPRYMLRHKVPAGMTGWAQVNGWRGDTSIDKRIEYDLYYIENWSIFLDIKILFLTLFRGFRNRNAY